MKQTYSKHYWNNNALLWSHTSTDVIEQRSLNKASGACVWEV